MKTNLIRDDNYLLMWTIIWLCTKKGLLYEDVLEDCFMYNACSGDFVWKKTPFLLISYQLCSRNMKTEVMRGCAKRLGGPKSTLLKFQWFGRTQCLCSDGTSEFPQQCDEGRSLEKWLSARKETRILGDSTEFWNELPYTNKLVNCFVWYQYINSIIGL